MTGRPRLRSVGCCVVVLLIAAAGIASAQSPAQRRALQFFRDSLDLVHDTVALHAWEARTIQLARVHRDSTLLHVRLGFLALRINELGGNPQRADDAAGEFEWATQLQPNWPYPWFGLGLAEAHAPDRARQTAGGLFTMLGLDRDTRAGVAFARSLQADPGFVEGLIAFAETARSQRLNAPIEPALDALRQVQASPLGWDPTLLLERGRLERLAGHDDSARVAFRRAEALDPDPAMAWLELARTLPLTADTVPAAAGEPSPVEIAYFNAAASDDPDVVALMRHDIQPIADDTTLAQLDRQHGVGRVVWLHQFWRQRAAVDLRDVASRLSEHFRRWDYVERHFRLPPFKRDYRWGIEIFQSHDDDLDDRGVVWLRQGAPATRIVWSNALHRAQPDDALRPLPLSDFDTLNPLMEGPTSRPHSIFVHRLPVAGSLIIDPAVGETPSYGNETWRYQRPEGDVVLNFAAQEDPDDYRLVESILDLDVSFDAMAQAAGQIPGLNQLLRSGPMTRAALAQEERLNGRRSIVTATTTSAWTRSYPVRLAGRALWLTAGTRNGLPLVHIIYAVDATMIRMLADRRTGMVPLRVRAVFLDSTGHAVAALDTIQPVRPPGPGVAMIAARAELPVPAGFRSMRLNVEANDALGALFPMDTLKLPDVHGTSLAMSSLVIGVAHASLPWEFAPGDTVWVSAHNTYAATDTLAVFAQMYGLHPGRSYTVRLALVRQRSALMRLIKRSPEAVTLTEHLNVSGPVAELRRTIALPGLVPGTYQLQLTVEAARERIVRRRILDIAVRAG